MSSGVLESPGIIDTSILGCPFVALPFVHELLLNKGVEIRIQPTVVDLFL